MPNGLITNFDSDTVGTCPSGWFGCVNGAQVDNTVSRSGANSLKIDDDGLSQPQHAFEDLADKGTQRLYFYVDHVDVGKTIVISGLGWRDGVSWYATYANVKLTESTGDLTLETYVSDVLGSPSLTTWTYLDLQWNIRGVGKRSSVRARMEGGEWTPWRNVNAIAGYFHVMRVGMADSAVPSPYSGLFYVDDMTSPVFVDAGKLVFTGNDTIQYPVPGELLFQARGAAVWHPSYEFTIEISDDGKAISGRGGGSKQPWLHRQFLDRRKSTLRDYPPKRKKPWLTSNFPEMEHFHWGNFTPFGLREVDEVNCGSRTLQVIVEPFSLECTETEFKVRLVGQTFGEVKWHISADDETDILNALDIRNDEKIQVELTGCSGTNPHIVTFIAIDDCGWAAGNLNIDGCPPIECASEPTISGADSIGLSDTEQYTTDQTTGVATWSISGGSGATIDQDGLVTTDANACGTATITYEDCCGTATKEVRLGDATTSYWHQISSEGNDTVLPGYCAKPDCSFNVTGCSSNNCTTTPVGGTRYKYIGQCCSPSPCVDPCEIDDACNPCSGGQTWAIRTIQVEEWRCNP